MFDRPVLAALALVVLATTGCEPLPDTAGGSPFLASNRRVVVPLTESGQFEVIGQPGDWSQEYFCAAGDFAQTKLRARGADRVVLVAPVGPAVTRSGTSAIFRIEPRETAGDLPPTGTSLNMRRTGENRTVSSARFFCERQKSWLW